MAKCSLGRNPSEKLLFLVSEETAKTYSEFGKVIARLCEFEDANSMERNAEQAKRTCMEQKALFLELQIVLHSISRAIVCDSEKKFSVQKVPCSCEKDHKNGMSLSKYLHLALTGFKASDTQNNFGHFGMNKEFFSQHFHHPNPEKLKMLLSAEVTKGVSKLSKSVLSFYKQEFTDKLLFAKISKFPDLLSEDIEFLKQQEYSIMKDKMSYLKHSDYYFDSVVNGINLFCKKYELQEQNETLFSSFVHFYTAKAEGLSLKVQLLKLQILNDAYNKETVRALKTIKEDLETKQEALERETVEKQGLLEAYYKVGGIFQDLVEEYSSLCSAVKNEKWAIQELEKSEEQ